MVLDTLLRQIHLSDKLFTHTPKFSHLAQLYFQVSNCAYHSHLQFSLVNTFFFILSNIIAYFLILTIFLKTPYYIYTPQPPKTDAIRQNKTENFHLLPSLLSHYSFFLFYSHRISLKDTSSILFLFHIIQPTIVSISNNSLALFIKLFQIIDDLASEKCCFPVPTHE